MIACDCVSHSCFLSVPLFFFFFYGSEVIILSWKDSLICNTWVCVKVGSSSQFLHFSYIIFVFYHRNFIFLDQFSVCGVGETYSTSLVPDIFLSVPILFVT